MISENMENFKLESKTIGLRCVVVVFAAAFLQLAAPIRTRGRNVSKGCEFPVHWRGNWFQKGIHPEILIEKDVLSFKGKCHESDGDLFFIEDSHSKDKCFRCVALYEKHPNVLQYRETFCDNFVSLQQACISLTADAALYSLFRVNAEPIPCPLRGPYTFSYSRGGVGECSYPVSTVDACTEDSKILFRFQACAEVMGTESSVEELTCMALWKEGSSHYLVGKMVDKKRHYPSLPDNNAYRCFIFEHLHNKDEIQISQTIDATCEGLVSIWEGSRTMRLTKRKHPTSSCHFPSWATAHHKWESLDGQRSFAFTHKGTSLRASGHQQDHEDTKYICITEVKENQNSSIAFITHGISGCESGFACVRLYERTKHIIEVEIGNFVRSPQDSCQLTSNEHYAETKDILTLVVPSSGSITCPNLSDTNGLSIQVGTYPSLSHNSMCGEPVLPLAAGCQLDDTMKFLITCATYTDIKSFRCHGNWEENGRNYLVTSLKDSKHRYCLVYKSTEKMTYVSGVRDFCSRLVNPGRTGNFTFNITAAGECDEILISSGCSRTLYLDVLLLAVILCSSLR